MSNQTFVQKWNARKREISSVLCVGIDPDMEKLPSNFLESSDPLYQFGLWVGEMFHPYATAWKPNVAFFEKFGSKGFDQMERLFKVYQAKYPSIPIVMDAKRGDLGNTAKEYADYYFKTLKVDALTVHPYMGFDSLEPYLAIGGFVFVLCLTSNPSSRDLQREFLKDDSKELYWKVLELVLKWNEKYPGQLGIVVGGTHPDDLEQIVNHAKGIPILVPGYGAQGGDLNSILLSTKGTALVNSSRGITLLKRDPSNAEDCLKAVNQIHKQMQSYFLEGKK